MDDAPELPCDLIARITASAGADPACRAFKRILEGPGLLAAWLAGRHGFNTALHRAIVNIRPDVVGELLEQLERAVLHDPVLAQEYGENGLDVDELLRVALTWSWEPATVRLLLDCHRAHAGLRLNPPDFMAALWRAMTFMRGEEVNMMLAMKAIPIAAYFDLICVAAREGDAAGVSVREIIGHMERTGRVRWPDVRSSVQMELNEALNLAARCGNQDALLCLMDVGADPFHGNGRALRSAAEMGKLHVVKRLMDLGVSNTPDALVGAAGAGRVRVLNHLLERAGVRRAQTHKALMNAIYHGRWRCIKLLLLHGQGSQGSHCMRPGFRALRCAISRGHLHIVRLLLDMGATARARSGRLLQHAAAAHRASVEMTRLLLDRGADPNACNGNALITAVQNGRIDLVALLVTRGADPNTQNGRAFRLAQGFDEQR